MTAGSVPHVTEIGMSEAHNQLREQIRRWLTAERMQTADLPNPNAYFHIQTTCDGLPFHIIEPTGMQGVIIVTGIMGLPPHQQTAFNELPEDRQLAFLWDLRFYLNQREYSFRIKDNISESDWLTIQRTFYSEDLRRTNLITALKELDGTFRGVMWMLEKQTGSRVAKTEPPKIYG